MLQQASKQANKQAKEQQNTKIAQSVNPRVDDERGGIYTKAREEAMCIILCILYSITHVRDKAIGPLESQ